MAYWIHESGNGTRAKFKVFFMDADTDLANLPTSDTEGVKQDIDPYAHECCDIGSQCLSIESSKVFVLNSENEWTDI